MKYSICITYFFDRPNIKYLIKELEKINSKNFEVIIRNDNPNHFLKIKTNLKKIKIINEKNKSIGEINSIKYLINKSKGKFISIISDDDIISYRIFNEIKNLQTNKINSLISFSDYDLKKLNKDIEYDFFSKDNLIKLFFSSKIHISGTIGTIYKAEFIKKNLNKICVKKYNFDTILFFLAVFDKKYFLKKKILGFNNFKTSKISSAEVDLNLYSHDTKELFKIFSKNFNNDTYYLAILYELRNYYSILFRKNTIFNYKNVNLHFSIFGLKKTFNRKIILFLKINFFLKIYLKKISIYLKNFFIFF